MSSQTHVSGQPQTFSVPGWAWFWLPVIAYFGQYAARALLDPAPYERFFTGESGITERATIVFLVLALGVGIYLLRFFIRRGNRRLAIWFGLFALGCLYFGGEEASWGQHWFGWGTPDAWQDINNQGETNLHNMAGSAGGLLDQLPRNLLTLAILIGGAIMPLWRRFRGATLRPNGFAHWTLPGLVCVPAGLIAPLSSVPEKIFEASYGSVPWPFDIEGGEVKELMIAMFLFIYALDTAARTRRLAGLR